MSVARYIALRSKCSRDQVGAVIVSAENRLIDTGYNGPPRGLYQLNGNCESWCPRAMRHADDPTLDPSYDNCLSLHAEQNALMFSDRRVREGGKIYVSSGVCGTCAKLIANSGLAEVIMVDNPQHQHRKTDRWCEFLEKCGLTVVTMQ